MNSPTPGRAPLRGLHGTIVEELGKQIAIGELAAGDPLSPAKIAEYFGVSLTVVREAMRSLQSLGMVDSRPNTGTRVLPMTHWGLFEPDVLRWSKQIPSLADDQAALLLALQTLRELEPALAGNIYFDALMRNLQAPAPPARGLHTHVWPATEQGGGAFAQRRDCACGLTYCDALKGGLVSMGEDAAPAAPGLAAADPGQVPR